MTAVNPFAALKSLLPDSPVLVGRVLAHNADDTSTISLPADLAPTYYADNVATGSIIRARGRTVAVGKNAFVRDGVVESEAPDEDAIEIEVGTTVVVPPDLAFSGTIPGDEFFVGDPFTLDLTPYWAGGLPPLSYAVISGPLPPGIVLDNVTGIVSGPSTAPGIYAVVFAGVDGGEHPVESNVVTLNSVAVPVVFTGAIPDLEAFVGVPFSVDLAPYWTGGFGVPTYSVQSGSLPGGLALNASTGVLSGTALMEESFAGVVFRLTDETLAFADSNAVLVSASGSPLLFSGTIPAQSPEFGVAFSVDLSTYWSGGVDPKTFSVQSGTLPDGLSLNSVTGVLSGTASVLGALTGIVFRATDAAAATADSNSVTVTVTDPNFSANKILLHFNGDVADSSINDIPVSLIGSATVSGGGKFGNSLTTVSGSRNGVETGLRSEFRLNQQNISVDFWVWFDATGADTRNLVRLQNVSETARFSTRGYVNSAGTMILDVRLLATTFQISKTGLGAAQWIHVKFVKKLGAMKAWINGTQGSSSNASSSVESVDLRLRIGIDYIYDAPTQLPGRVDEVRVRIGDATASWQPPAAAFPDGGSSDVLHMHFDSDFTDVSPVGRSIELVGTPVIYTDSSKFGAGCFRRTVSGSYPRVLQTADLLLDGDFTVQCYVRFNTTADSDFVTFGGTTALRLGTASTGYIVAKSGTTSRLSGFGYVSPVTTGVWYHVAAVRSGSDTRLFLDGLCVLDSPSTSSFAATLNQYLIIGSTTTDVDELRVTNTALYSKDFTPPPYEYPDL